VYRAVAGRRSVILGRMAAMLEAMFGDGHEPAGAHAVDRREVKSGDVRRILAMLRTAEQKIRDFE
jgi:hypothetical protein